MTARRGGAEMTARPETAEGPVAQSLAVLFGVLRVFTLLLAAGWATSNIRQVPPGTQAVVLRFGRVVSVQQSGLVPAWPRPLETVVNLPGPERQHVQAIAARTARVPGIVEDATMADAVPEDAGLYLTGDGGVVLLQGAVTWHIVDAAAYYLAAEHVAPALRRVFMRAALQVAASRPLDDFLAVRPERAEDPAAAAARQAVRGDIVSGMNAQLAALRLAGTPLGVEVTRADITALLPPEAKSSFDSVLDATQRAEQNLATARTEAARTRAQGERERDAALTGARAAAEERVNAARTATAAISAIEKSLDPARRGGIMTQLYRDRIGVILSQAQSVSAVDAKAVSRVILPGTP